MEDLTKETEEYEKFIEELDLNINVEDFTEFTELVSSSNMEIDCEIDKFLFCEENLDDNSIEENKLISEYEKLAEVSKKLYKKISFELVKSKKPETINIINQMKHRLVELMKVRTALNATLYNYRKLIRLYKDPKVDHFNFNTFNNKQLKILNEEYAKKRKRKIQQL